MPQPCGAAAAALTHLQPASSEFPSQQLLAEDIFKLGRLPGLRSVAFSHRFLPCGQLQEEEERLEVRRRALGRGERVGALFVLHCPCLLAVIVCNAPLRPAVHDRRAAMRRTALCCAAGALQDCARRVQRVQLGLHPITRMLAAAAAVSGPRPRPPPLLASTAGAGALRLRKRSILMVFSLGRTVPHLRRLHAVAGKRMGPGGWRLHASLKAGAGRLLCPLLCVFKLCLTGSWTVSNVAAASQSLSSLQLQQGAGRHLVRQPPGAVAPHQLPSALSHRKLSFQHPLALPSTHILMVSLTNGQGMPTIASTYRV